jgi:isopenicillin-N N-acyltransferase like protein
MRVIECSGNPREIGRQTGEALREEIRSHLELIPRRESADLVSQMNAALKVLNRKVPEIVEEMAGIANGAAVSVDEIHRINIPLGPDELRAMDDTCSNVAFASGPDGPILGKNNDGLGIRRPVYLKKMRSQKGVPIVAFPFAGWVGTASGMNAEGLAIGSSSVGSVLQRSYRHVPLRFWSYLVMQRCRTAAEYIEAMTERPLRGKGFSLLCVDRDGTAVSLEAPSPLIQVRRAEGRPIINCVNCYQIPAIANMDLRTKEGKANALARIKLFEGECNKGGVFDLDRMQKLLRHHGSPNVCRHIDEEDSAETEYSYICLPEQNEVLYLNGNPCQNEYSKVTL